MKRIEKFYRLVSEDSPKLLSAAKILGDKTPTRGIMRYGSLEQMEEEKKRMEGFNYPAVMVIEEEPDGHKARFAIMQRFIEGLVNNEIGDEVAEDAQNLLDELGFYTI